MYCKILILITALFVAVYGQSGWGEDNEEIISLGDIKLNPKYKECYIDGNARCESNKQKYQFLDTWTTKDCHKCQCFEDVGILCCDMRKLPTDWPSHCIPEYDITDCRLKLNCSPWRKPAKRLSRKKKVFVASNVHLHGRHPKH